MIVCTVTSARYLFLAKVMAKSVKEHMPNAKTVICIVEEEIPEKALEYPHFDHLVLAKDLGIDSFYEKIFKYKAIEAITSVKGQLFLYLLEKFNDEESFVFFDTDIKVYGPLVELENALETHNVVLTPQLLTPQEVINDSVDWEQIVSLKGTFNTGFLAIKRSEEGENFIRWWAKRLEHYCFDDMKKGMFVDQKWMDLAPCFFNVHILKHPGYNAALWNIPKREIHLDESWDFKVNRESLRFFHFVDTDVDWIYKKSSYFIPERNDDFFFLVNQYTKETKQMLLNEPKYDDWCYDYFASGEKITDQTRWNYRNYKHLYEKYGNPFYLNNEIFH